MASLAGGLASTLLNADRRAERALRSFLVLDSELGRVLRRRARELNPEWLEGLSWKEDVEEEADVAGRRRRPVVAAERDSVDEESVAPAAEDGTADEEEKPSKSRDDFRKPSQRRWTRGDGSDESPSQQRSSGRSVFDQDAERENARWKN